MPRIEYERADRMEEKDLSFQPGTSFPAVVEQERKPKGQGKVYLVGAGPGDPELITVKGLRCLRTADVIIYDRLANPALLNEAAVSTELIYVGKRTGYCALRQEEINALLIAQARLGRKVVRLKGGDPCVFGRGGEEALALVAAKIEFEIVPGISSALAVPTYAGIPVTHRGESGVLTIVTGHEQPGHFPTLVNWESLARVEGTLVILMGLATLPTICQCLLTGGMDAKTPATVIEQGTTAQQRQVKGILADIATRAEEADIRSPAIVVIGRVVDLSATLSWFAPQERIQIAEGLSE